MFRKTKGGENESAAEHASATDLDAPPLKPFSKRGSHTPASAVGAVARRESARQMAELVGPARRVERGRVGQAEGSKLIVGRDIQLKGEITACDKLVVEGTVEAEINDARVIEVAPTGHFKGDAQVDEADVSGRYEGRLTAKDKLTVRSTGRVSGSIRYGRIVIEAGGQVSGDMQTLTDADGGRSTATEIAPAAASEPDGR